MLHDDINHIADQIKATLTASNGASPQDAAGQEFNLISDDYRELFDGAGFGMILVDAETRKIIDVNDSVLRMIGLRKQAVVGRICHKFVCPAEEHKCPVLDLGKTVDRSERQLCRCDGSTLPVLKSVVPITINGRRILLESMVDMTELKSAQEALRVSEQRYALAARGSNDGLWDWDLVTQEVFYSERWKAMLGCGENEISPTCDAWFCRVHEEDISRLKNDLDRHLHGNVPHFQTEVRMAHRDGTYRWMLIRGEAVRDQAGRPLRIAGSQTDITERKRVEDELRRGVFYDSLTALANRALFIDRLERSLARARKEQSYRFSVILLDIDQFKVINESLGYHIGDRLLVAVAERLRNTMRNSETSVTLARMGDDEFAFLLEDISRGDVIHTAEKICGMIKGLFNISGQEVRTSASVGVAFYDGTPANTEDILRDAGSALHQAKTEGGGVRFS